MASSVPDQEMYSQLKLLGEGSFGKAYLVRCESDGTLCVIKKMEMKSMTENEKQETIREAHILEALNHPNIVRFREVYKTKRNQLCIVMDYCDGGDLSKKILEYKGRFIPENQVLDWFTQVCLAIKHVHDRKIVHRDLKAQNIFLMKDNTLKVGDFGIAKVLRHTRENCRTMVGTPYYISPEIIESKPYSFRSDVWSLGIILYEMCTQKPPFDGIGLPQLALKIVSGKYSPISSYYSKEMSGLIAILLNIDPLKRPTVNQILKMPIVSNRIKKFLSENILKNEFSHTVLHNRNFVNNNLNLDSIPLPRAPQSQSQQPHQLEKQPSSQLNIKQNYPVNPTPSQHQQIQEGFLVPQNRNIIQPQQQKNQNNIVQTPNTPFQGQYNPFPQANKPSQQQQQPQQIQNQQIGFGVQFKKPEIAAQQYNYGGLKPSNNHPPLQKLGQGDRFFEEARRAINQNNLQQDQLFPLDKLKREVSEPIIYSKPKPLYDIGEYKKQQQAYQQQLQQLAQKDKLFEKKIENMRAELANKKEADYQKIYEPTVQTNEDSYLSPPSNQIAQQNSNQNNNNNNKIGGQPQNGYKEVVVPATSANNIQSKQNIRGPDSYEEKERRRQKVEEERKLMIDDIKLRRSKINKGGEFDKIPTEGVQFEKLKSQPNEKLSSNPSVIKDRDIPVEIYVPQVPKSYLSKEQQQQQPSKVNEKHNYRYARQVSESNEEQVMVQEKEDISYLPKHNSEVVSKLLELNLESEEGEFNKSNSGSDDDISDSNKPQNELVLELDKSIIEIQNKFKERNPRVIFNDDDDDDDDEDESSSDERDVQRQKGLKKTNDDKNNVKEKSQQMREIIQKNFKDVKQESCFDDSSSDEELYSDFKYPPMLNPSKKEKENIIGADKIVIEKETEQKSKRIPQEKVPQNPFKENQIDTMKFVLESRLGKSVLQTTINQLKAFTNTTCDNNGRSNQSDSYLATPPLWDFDSLHNLSKLFVTLSPELADELGPMIIMYFNILTPELIVV